MAGAQHSAVSFTLTFAASDRFSHEIRDTPPRFEGMASCDGHQFDPCISEAQRGLRTEFRPFSRVLRLKSPAGLSPQIFPDQEMERPKPRRHGRQIERGGTICGEWIAGASIRWVRPALESAAAVRRRAIARTRASAGRTPPRSERLCHGQTIRSGRSGKDAPMRRVENLLDRAARSVRRLTQNPRGRRPSIAASARTGEMNARDSVIRIERSRLPSRIASDSMVWAGSNRSSSSQR